MPSTAVNVSTSVIKINLSHSIYNQLVNLAKIFEIKGEEEKTTKKQIQKKRSIMKSAML